jgi:ubiquinone/menaquinone biosynthesis C-methylase UbiE
MPVTPRQPSPTDSSSSPTTVAAWMDPATDAMLAMADVHAGTRVLDLASGAGSQTLAAARRVGAQGSLVASDISDTMLHHVRENARAARLANVTTLAGAAEDLDVARRALMRSSVGPA